MDNLIKFKDDGKENPLIQRLDLWEEALNQFSRMSFNEASLSEILRNVGMNKGSFYFKFYDKMDLYLCTVERIGQHKSAFLKTKLAGHDPMSGFWGQLKAIVTGALELARTEPRYDGFWRYFLNENEDVKKTVKTAFPEINSDFLGVLVDSAIATGQLTKKYDRDFVYSTVSLYFNNMDSFITPNMSGTEIDEQVGKVIGVLKQSLGTT